MLNRQTGIQNYAFVQKRSSQFEKHKLQNLSFWCFDRIIQFYLIICLPYLVKNLLMIHKWEVPFYANTLLKTSLQ